MAQSGDGRFLYSLNNGNGTISVFRVKSDGSFKPLIVVSGIPTSAAGWRGVKGQGRPKAITLLG